MRPLQAVFPALLAIAVGCSSGGSVSSEIDPSSAKDPPRNAITFWGNATGYIDIDGFGIVTDPMAVEMPEPSQLVISDGALQAEIDTRDGKVRKALSDLSSGRIAEIMAWEQELGIPVLPLSAGEPTLPQIRRLMGISGRRR